MATATKTRFKCTICRGRIPAGKAVYSKFTHLRYCADTDACQKRARKAARSC